MSELDELTIEKFLASPQGAAMVKVHEIMRGIPGGQEIIDKQAKEMRRTLELQRLLIVFAKQDGDPLEDVNASMIAVMSLLSRARQMLDETHEAMKKNGDCQCTEKDHEGLEDMLPITMLAYGYMLALYDNGLKEFPGVQIDE